jgi:hypothetical protein
MHCIAFLSGANSQRMPSRRIVQDINTSCSKHIRFIHGGQSKHAYSTLPFTFFLLLLSFYNPDHEGIYFSSSSSSSSSPPAMTAESPSTTSSIQSALFFITFAQRNTLDRNNEAKEKESTERREGRGDNKEKGG